MKAKEDEGILTHDDQKDGEELQVRDQVSHTAIEGGWGVVFSLDVDVRVQLYDGSRVLLEHFTVTSGDTVLELEHGPCVQGGLGYFSGFYFWQGIRGEADSVTRRMSVLQARSAEINVPDR